MTPKKDNIKAIKDALEENTITEMAFIEGDVDLTTVQNTAKLNDNTTFNEIKEHNMVTLKMVATVDKPYSNPKKSNLHFLFFNFILLFALRCECVRVCVNFQKHPPKKNAIVFGWNYITHNRN